MRSRSLALLVAAFGLATAIAPAASASGRSKGSAPASVPVASAPLRAIAFNASAKPWLFAGKAPLAANAPVELRARALVALRAVVSDAAGLDLVATGVDQFGDGDRVVRFGQMHMGLPVLGGGAAVRLNAKGDTVLTSASLARELPSSVTPTVPAGAAAAIARTRTAFGVKDSDPKLVVLVVRGEAKLAYVVFPAVPQGLGVMPRIMIDAHTGAVIEVRDVTQHADVFAKMYATNPIKSPTLEDHKFAISPTGAGGILSNDVINSLNCAGDGVVKDVTLQGFPLKVRACELTQTALPTSAGHYDYTPTDDPANKSAQGSDTFSEVSMYYHASRIYDFYRSLQGDPTAKVVVEVPLRTISNLRVDVGFVKLLSGQGTIADLPGDHLEPLSNAFYSPAGGGLGDIFAQLYGFTEGAMWFFQGPSKDYAYDGDVVYHEFTHAMINNTIQLEAWHMDKYGAVDSPGAMNEGLADYFSSALAGDPDVGEYASKDIDPNLKVIRTLDNTDACPSGVAGEVHNDSTLFSGALWQARASLGSESERLSFDKAIYKAIRTAGAKPDVGYEDAGKLFIATLTTDFAAGATALTKAFTDRGIFPACARQYTYADKPIVVPKASGLPGFGAPGLQTIAGSKTTAPGILQIKVPLSNTAKLTVTFTVPKTSAGAGGGLGGTATPFAPQLAVKWGDAITWTTTGTLKSDADLTVVPTLAAQTYTADIDVPAGSTAAALQVVNAGDSDGYYNNVTVTSVAAPPVETPDAGATTAGSGATPTTADVSSGCSCSVPAQKQTASGLFLAVLGGLGLAFRRRRRG